MENSAAGIKSGRYTFAAFSFDAATGELTRNRHSERIRKQTADLLTVLLERAGSVVTREELRERLWPEGEFVDYERAINRAINQLRAVLRDDPRVPRFIETLPKRGYRFCAPVTVEVVESAGTTFLLSESLPPQRAEPPVSSEMVPLVGDPVVKALVPGSSADRWHLEWLSRYRAALTAILLLAFCAAGLSYWLLKHRGHPAGPIHMGIVPFEAQGVGAIQLAQSFRLDLMDTMSQLPDVELRAAHSLDRMKSDDPTLQQVATQLQLDVLLLGRLTMEGDRCTFQFELVRARDMAHLMSVEYSSSRDSVEVVRGRLRRDVFDELQLAGKPLRTVRGSTEDAQAYTDYLQGRDGGTKGTVESLNQALQSFQAAIDRDPGFAQAYSGMAATQLSLSDRSRNADHLPLARHLAQEALARDPNLAEAHAVLGAVAFRLDWNAEVAEREMRRAVELEPHYAVYHAWLSQMLVATGQFQEALEEVDKARTADPLWPSIYMIDGFVSGAARQNTRMIAAARTDLELFPTSVRARDLLAWSYFSSGRYKEAVDAWKEMATLEKDPERMALEEQGWAAFQRGGLKGLAAVRVKAIEAHAPATLRHPNDFVPAEWYACMGDRKKAVAALKEMVDAHDNGAVNIAVNPMYDPLHDDPDFRALLARVGLSLPISYPKETRAAAQ